MTGLLDAHRTRHGLGFPCWVDDWADDPSHPGSSPTYSQLALARRRLSCAWTTLNGSGASWRCCHRSSPVRSRKAVCPGKKQRRLLAAISRLEALGSSRRCMATALAASGGQRCY
jgi:hypothetical protein